MRERRRRGRGGFWIILILALLAYALVYSNYKVRTTEYTLSSARLPDGFDGVTAAVISDCHGRFDDAVIDAAEGADLVFLVGDIIDDASQLTDAVAFAEKLAARCGVYYVTGNHEWSTGAVYDFMEALRGIGVHVLQNQFVTLSRGGSTMNLVGLEDPNGPADMAKPAQVLGGLTGCTVLLSHRPYDYREYADLGADFIISGHLHGGMIRLPGVGGLIGPGHELLPELDGGLYEYNGSTLVVSRGLAGVGRFPRLFNPREVVLITFRKGQSA